MEGLAIISPLLIGSAIIVILFPKDGLKKINFILTVCLGTGIGLGLTSCLTFIWLSTNGQPTSNYFLGEFSFSIFLFLIACYRVYNLKDAQSNPIFSSNTEYSAIRWLRNIFYILLVFYLAAYILKTFGDSPHGRWDAWAIWNFRARWLFRGEDQWIYAFSKHVLSSHPDYPLLLPVSIFRIWNIVGKDIQAIPILIAGFFSFGSILLILYSITMLRGPNQGYLAAIFMLLATKFLKISAFQYSDTPLSFYILSTFILFSIKERYPIAALRLMFLAGFTASCATWTKNEGMLFLVLIVFVHFLFDSITNDWRQTRNEFFSFLLGLTPVFSTVVFFKLKFAPSNDIVNANNLSRIWEYLSQFDRYQQIFLAFVEKITFFNDGIVILMVVYLAISGLDRPSYYQKRFFSQVALLILLLGGYFFSFLISPNPLDWHLHSSSALSRLIIQTWPSWVFLFFYCVRGPEKSRVTEPHGEGLSQ